MIREVVIRSREKESGIYTPREPLAPVQGRMNNPRTGIPVPADSVDERGD